MPDANELPADLPTYRLQDIFSASGWTPTRSTIDYLTDLAAEAIEALPQLMIQRLLAGQYLGLDDTGVTLIMPRENRDGSWSAWGSGWMA